MRANTIKAVLAMSEFFTYNVTPEELVDILARIGTEEASERDKQVIQSMRRGIRRAMNESLEP